MGAFKKASKLNQKTHRERHQPEKRKHLGLLEKHKDYVKRAKDYNDKKATLKLLHKRALNKNPDEFYYHMINSKIEKGIHHENGNKKEETPEQLQLMRSQDLKYVSFKRTQEFKKIERLQGQLHLCSVSQPAKNTHIRFRNNLETNNVEGGNKHLKILEEIELPDIDIEALKKASRKRKQKYMELAKRVNREKELSLIEEKIRIKKYLNDKKITLKPEIISEGSSSSAPVYKWKYERKK